MSDRAAVNCDCGLVFYAPSAPDESALLSLVICPGCMLASEILPSGELDAQELGGFQSALQRSARLDGRWIA
jgi:hypothetical protein